MDEENRREREVHRYYQTWLESTAGFSAVDRESAPKRFHPDGSSLRASNDKTLIAFAQLGCLRLNAKRGVVTLIGTHRQYILAEATKTLSLISDLTEDAEHDEIWFGNASLPRSQGISERALDPPEYTAVGRSGKQYTAKALVINDITRHERLSNHAIAGNGVTFYCGVPIFSKSGFPIGVYNVTDDKPREGLTPAELVFMQDMSEIVMQHLETVKNDAARFRGEKLIIGLADFMRGGSSTNLQPPRYAAPKFTESEVISDGKASVNKSDFTRDFKGMTITNADPNLLRETLTPQKSVDSTIAQTTSHLPPSGDNVDTKGASESPQKSASGSDKDVEPLQKVIHNLPQSQNSKPKEDSESSRSERMDSVFSRAATVLRSCTDADGVVFFDATPINPAARHHKLGDQAQLNQLRMDSETSQDSASDDYQYSSSSASTDSDSLHSDQPRILRAKGQKCHMLGYALDVSSSSTANVDTIRTLGLTERSLRHFIRRYPRGKAFYFDTQGDFSASEEDASKNVPKTSTMDKLEAAIKLKPNRYSSRAVAEELIHVVPGARSVVWLPLWDFHKQRWRAGMFLWSRRPTRLLTAQDDMAYLKTFACSILIEVSRIDAQFSDEAKATFIANISHELRSPLHGILGSVEFLQETALNAFQSSMAFGIETCAKTLLDTVEHVLDYAKINQTSAKFAKRSGSRGSDPSVSQSTLEDDLDLAELFEEVIEAVHAGETFRSSQRKKEPSPMVVAQSLPDGNKQTTRANIQNQSNRFSSAVRLILRIDRQLNWWVRAQPGAIRRVIMNILGNALKYTNKGYISISLAMSEENSENSSDRKIRMTFKDTGRGMSAAFLKDHAFTPFSQESQFSEGIGLGLSIVRQIVQSLAGRIDLKSTKGSGTEIRITMTLPMVANPPARNDPNSILSIVMEKTPGMTMCIIDPTPKSQSTTGDNVSQELVQSSICELAESWFGMKTVRATSMDGVEADFFVYAEPPPIDYLLNHHGQHSRETEVPLIIVTTSAFESACLTANGIDRLTDLGRVIEVVAQPCGPQKLAKTLHRCLTRLQELAKDPKNFSVAKAVTPSVHETVDLVAEPGGSQDPSNTESYVNQIESPQDKLENKTPSKGDLSRPEAASPGLGDMEQNVERERTSPGLVEGTVSNRASNHTADPGVSSPSDEDTISAPVLLVDDNEINLNLLVAFMKKAQRPYVKAENGLLAVQAYKEASSDPKKAFKHILMDISMPVMDGIEATRKIRQHEKETKIPGPATIITLTGLSMEATRKEMMAVGADYFLSKPVKFKQLIELLH